MYVTTKQDMLIQCTKDRPLQKIVGWCNIRTRAKHVHLIQIASRD